MFEIDFKGLVFWGITSIAAGIIYLIRMIFTSKAKIDLLEQALKEVQEERQDHDRKVDALLTELRHDVKNLLSRKELL